MRLRITIYTLTAKLCATLYAREFPHYFIKYKRRKPLRKYKHPTQEAKTVENKIFSMTVPSSNISINYAK
jgi:hypothetical protein